MFILDSLSLTRAAATFQPQMNLKPTTSLTKSKFKNQENCDKILIPLTAISPAIITDDSCEITTNKCKLVQEQEQQPKEKHESNVVEKLMIQKKPSSSSYKIKEMIKNNNKNLNDKLAVTAVENYTTIADNRMPEEEQQRNDNENRNESSSAMGTRKVPAIYNRQLNNDSSDDINASTKHQTRNRNISPTINTPTTSQGSTFKALNVENADKNCVRAEEIMLSNIQNSADINTFASPPEAATVSTPTTLQSCNSCYTCLPLCICVKDTATKGMLMPPQRSEINCSINNDSGYLKKLYDHGDVAAGGIFCHKSRNKNCNNCNNNNNSIKNKNNIILNANSFVTVERTRLTCENEREQEIRNLIQNGYKNSGDAADGTATVAASTSASNSNSSKQIIGEKIGRREQQDFSLNSHSERNNAQRKKEQIGNLLDANISPIASPMDSILETFEKFLNAVKLENRNLNQNVCHDLIDFSEEPKSSSDGLKEHVTEDECDKLEVVNLAENCQEQTKYDGKMQAKDFENQCKLENLLYCDLNETLEEQNVLESKDILELTTTEAAVEAAQIINTLTEINEMNAIADYADDNDKDKTKILMVDGLNETVAKTAVTCTNVYTNYNNDNESSKNNSKEQPDTCVVVPQSESCQNSKSCSVTTVTETTTTARELRVPLENVIKNQICSLSSIEKISPLIPAEYEKIYNLKQSDETNNCIESTAATQIVSISCSTTDKQTESHTDLAECINNCHHSLFEQQQLQEGVRIRDQSTSAYTLRDFAKCLKPAAGEDIIYTLRLTQNENEKEKVKKINFNSNLNTQTNFNESVSSDRLKSIDNCALSEKQVNSQGGSIKNINENNLCNTNFESHCNADNDNINYSPANHRLIQSKYYQTEEKSELNVQNSFENYQGIVRFKDTQFLEIENLSTPTFFKTASQQLELNATRKTICTSPESIKCQAYLVCENLNENLQNIELFDNELKFDCDEKIYTKAKNSQPLLYLTFVWPTRNEGQVVTTRRQGNDEQGENETVKELAEEVDEEDSKKEHSFNSNYKNSNKCSGNSDNNKKNCDDKCDFCCEFKKRTLEQPYGTCNKKHVECFYKGQQLKAEVTKEANKCEQEAFRHNRDCDDDLLIDKQNCEHKNQCTTCRKDSRQTEQLIINEKYFHSSAKSLTSDFLSEYTNNSKIVENIKNNNINSFKESSEENFNENEIILARAKCILQCENIENNTDDQFRLRNEINSQNNTEIQKQVLDIKRTNTDLTETKSVYNQDNGRNILNLNQSLKGLNETNQLFIHATCSTPLISQKQYKHYHHPYQLEWAQNLEEFEASQRLKRLLQQHQQFRTRYDTIPTTHCDVNYKQNTIIETTEESLKTEIARHSKDDLCFANNKQQGGVFKSLVPIISRNLTTTTSTRATKANKLQADCEITLERSSLLRANEYKEGTVEIDKISTQEQKNYSSSKEQKEEESINHIEKDKEKKEIANRLKENEFTILNNKKETKENKRNSPLAYISKKIVRLTQQQQQFYIQQPSRIHSNPLSSLGSTEKHQDQQEQQEHQQEQQNNVIADNLANLRLPTENTIDKTDISHKPSPSKLCNLNLQHIVKTKQLLQREQEQEQQQEQKHLIQTETKSCTPSPPGDQLINEYKSAFVPTKPEIYKYLKPLTGTSGKNLPTTTTTTSAIPLISSSASLSEFDTQRFSDFFYLNHLPTSPNNNNQIYNYNINTNNNNSNCHIAHVLPIQHYSVHATNFVDTIQLPYCYDELFINETQQPQELKQHELINAVAATKIIEKDTANATVETVNSVATEVGDDLESISSTNSSPCDCTNCQQLIEQEIDRVRDRDFDRDRVHDRDRLISFDANVIPVVSLTEAETLKLKQQQEQQQQTLFKMREVNGQLRGLLKKPNRPPPTRKNRVVFDETRNEFFEADYIILIREDCAYDEEDEEPCTCGEHELVRLCCEEGCQCNYSTAAATTDDNRTPQSPKYAPPIEFVDEAALSPPDGYKDNGLKNTLGGALSGHIFGAQHLQQLQVIQRLQQQRAAMLAARNNSQIPPPPSPATAAQSSAVSGNQQLSTAPSTCSSSLPMNSSSLSSASPAVATAVVSNSIMNTIAPAQQHSPDDDAQGVCTECAECAECAAKQLQQDTECNSPQYQLDLTAPLGVPAVALLPIHTSSPERRMTQKEIIAGEERPRYVLQAQYKSSPVKSSKDANKTKNDFTPVQNTNNQRYIVETMTMTTTTTVSERRVIREATEDLAATPSSTSTPPSTGTSAVSPASDTGLLPPALPAKPGATTLTSDLSDSEKPPPIPPKENSPTTQISGILKGGKLWKQDSTSQHSDDQNNTTSEDEAGSTSNGTMKRSVRFVTEESNNDEADGQLANADEDNQINELIPIKKHSTLFKNALRPNSAVQQLFPSTVAHQTLTSEALRAFDESKRAGCLVSTLPGSAGDSDTLRRSMERNILRRSLIKKKAIKSDISLEERIKQLTCGIDEDNDDVTQENGDEDNSKIEDSTDLSHRDSPAGEENPQKFNLNGNSSDKSFSPNSSVSSSSSGSSAYKKITEIFNREKKNQEKIMEMEENPIVIIPQECRCPAAPDLGMGIQVPVVHTQIHRTPPRQTEPKRQFLSTLAPLTACVAGNKDDLSSYYTLAAAHHNQSAHNAHTAEYNLAAMMANEQNITGLSQNTVDEVRKVAPDVIAGTPGQEQQDELAAFVQQEANRTDKIKKRYSSEPTNTKESNKEINSDDDEGNDYGFNKRPSVRGIKPKFSSTNEILQQMQEQLTQQMPSVAHSQPLPQPMKSYTLPKQSSASAMTKPLSQQQPSPQNVPHTNVATSQQQLPQQQQICSAVAGPAAMQIPTNAPIAQQQTEQRTWSFYSETGASEQQSLPVESAAAAMQQTYYQTLPTGAMFRHTMIHQHQQHVPEEAMLYAQNCQAMAATIESQPHYGHYARSPTRRPESPPPLRNYHQTMVLIPYNAETYSQFAATNMDPKVAHIQRQNILEYQQVTQQTIRVPIGYALPGMQLHVVAGRGHTAQYATSAAAHTHHHQHQRIMTQRYQFAQEASMPGFSERGVPEGAAAVSHSDCTSSGMVSPTSGQQIALQQQQQQQQQQHQQHQQQQQLQQQGAQIAQQQQHPQQQSNCQQTQPQAQTNMQSAAQGSVYYAMNV